METSGTMTDKEFFQAVSEEPLLARFLASDEWAPGHVYGPIHGRNAGLKVWKHAWRLSHLWPEEETVEVHFESRHRGRLQVDVEIYPYEGSIDKDSARLKALEGQLQLKRRLLTAIRNTVIRDSALCVSLGATTARLRDPDVVSTLGAVQFECDGDVADSPSAAAIYYVQVIQAVTPIIDQAVTAATRAPAWSRRPLDTGIEETLAALRSAYTVKLISTLGDDLQTLPMDELRHVDDDPFAQFDFIPTTQSGHISGVYCRATRKNMPLDASMLLPAGSSLLGFIERADESGFGLVVQDRQIAGIVTLSDLQKLPVYHVLFGLIVSVELLLVEWIRIVCQGEPDKWLDGLNSSARGRIESWFTEAMARNVALDKLSVASFQHEISAADHLGLFKHEPVRKATLYSLKEFRDEVCHGMELAPNVSRALEMPVRVRETLEMIEALQEEIIKARA